VSAVYLDSSALVKLLLREPETESVLDIVNRHVDDGMHVVTSALTKVELNRVRVRLDQAGPVESRFPASAIDHILDAIALIEITDQVVDDAADIEHHVKSLDAIHLATALQLGDELEELVTFDANMRRVGQLLELPVSGL
jgi:predicted nucleic acid-binding protein